jgi:predicted nucleic acid-binding protein
VTRGLLDTSIFIAQEQARPLAALPQEIAVSVVTLGELELGVLSADDGDTRARRASTLSTARASDPVPIVEATMTAFAALVHDCRGAGLRPKVLDALIAATAIEQGLPVVPQDDDFDSMARVHSRLSVERV